MRTTKKEIEAKSFKKNYFNETFQDTIFTCLIFVIMIIIITNPKRYTAGTISGIKLFFFSVLPGLFPFMLLTKLLTELGMLFKMTKHLNKPARFLFGTPGVSLYAFFMSILSGYPIGAKIIDDLYQKKLITEADAKKMTIFCTTSGPIFVIGAVGTIMLKSFKIGIILYVSHILSCVLIAIFVNLFNRNRKQNQEVLGESIIISKKDNILGSCVIDSINSIFIVGAYITIFYLLTEIFESIKIFDAITFICSPLLKILKIDTSYFKGTLYGILEVTRGCKELSVSFNKLSISLCSALISFSGISIIMQSMVFLKNAKIKTRNFIFNKIAHSILSFIICYLLLIILWVYICLHFNVVDCIFKLITVAFYNSEILV